MNNQISTYDKYDPNNRPKYKKQFDWDSAIGLQDVDKLKTSKYLNKLSQRNINNDITQEEVYYKINEYYKIKENRARQAHNIEADLVATNIQNCLSQTGFSLRYTQLLSIHKELFKNIENIDAGSIRNYNIMKNEWLLDNETVIYENFPSIRSTLEYDFSQQQNVNFNKMNQEEFIDNIAKFISNIWQVHPFGEGNTRTTAVFCLKYLNSLGFESKNSPFKENSLYFRNCLVLANYKNIKRGVSSNIEPLKEFLSVLIYGSPNGDGDAGKNIPFRNRELYYLVHKDNPKIKGSKDDIKNGIQAATSYKRDYHDKDAR